MKRRFDYKVILSANFKSQVLFQEAIEAMVVEGGWTCNGPAQPFVVNDVIVFAQTMIRDSGFVDEG